MIYQKEVLRIVSIVKSNEKRNGILCKECEINYILNIDDNTCEKRNDYPEFDYCLEIKNENGKFICTKCKPYFSLLKGGDEAKCLYSYFI